jgi:hypothetical protein
MRSQGTVNRSLQFNGLVKESEQFRSFLNEVLAPGFDAVLASVAYARAALG